MLKKVLIIEDDPALRISVEQTLELYDLHPIATSSFVQARRTIRSNFAGVILSDIKMPDQDGFDILSFVQQRDPDLPVVLFTGHSDVPTAMRAMKEGAYDYLEKPCEPERLVETLQRALNHRELVLQNRTLSERDQSDDIDLGDETLATRLEQHERKIIEAALRAQNGRVAQAAKGLGMPRNTFYDRMTKLKIVAKSFRSR